MVCTNKCKMSDFDGVGIRHRKEDMWMRREFLQNMFEANIQEASIVLKKETLTSKDMEDVMFLLNDARKYAWRIKYLVEAEKQH